MIPFNVAMPNGTRVPITWASVFWLGVVTTVGTVLGAYIYAYLQSNYPQLGALGTPTPAPAPKSTLPSATV